MVKNLKTVAELRAAVKKAPRIYVQPRLGCSEYWVKITKANALKLVASISEDTTPDELETGTGDFGSVMNSGAVYIG